MTQVTLRGVRFAPSPTGRFHVGNLRTGWISHRLAQLIREPWAVRFEDIDKIRVIAGADDEQLSDLEKLGCKPDEIVYQSAREDRHWQLFERAVLEKKVYPCFCSAKGVRHALQSLASAANSLEPAPVYTGCCRDLTEPQEHHFPSVGWRFRGLDPSGRGDFLIARAGPKARLGEVPSKADFASSYHWACAIDDLDGKYSLIVRAWDLEPAAAIQREIQNWVDPKCLPPAAFHTALVLTDDGARLEKRTRGVTLAELVNRGISSEALARGFETSFQIPDLTFKPGSLAGENRREIRLHELI
jgi:glutamyl-tRNA synthetase